jgi:hypothetical protein
VANFNRAVMPGDTWAYSQRTYIVAIFSVGSSRTDSVPGL